MKLRKLLLSVALATGAFLPVTASKAHGSASYCSIEPEIMTRLVEKYGQTQMDDFVKGCLHAESGMLWINQSPSYYDGWNCYHARTGN